MITESISEGQLRRRMADAKAAYKAGNEVVACSALNMCRAYALPVPDWLYSAALELMQRGLLVQPAKAGRGRHARITARLYSNITDVETAARMIAQIDRGKTTWDDFSDAEVKAYKRAVRQARSREGADFLRGYVSDELLTQIATRRAQGNK